jgi:ABC-type multidrug transport system fused ATPase/permease subunit
LTRCDEPVVLANRQKKSAEGAFGYTSRILIARWLSSFAACREGMGGTRLGSARGVAALWWRAALTEVSFGVNDGDLFSIIGPNGAGKTSIVNCISGRYRPTEGQLFYHGRDITALNPNARPSLGIGRTFPNLALLHHMSVLDNIMVGRDHLLKNNFITGSLY